MHATNLPVAVRTGWHMVASTHIREHIAEAGALQRPCATPSAPRKVGTWAAVMGSSEESSARDTWNVAVPARSASHLKQPHRATPWQDRRSTSRGPACG